MEMRDFGLLGFHFLVSLNEKTTVNNLFSTFKVNYITKNHVDEISVSDYNELIAKDYFEDTITAYIGTNDDCSFSITYHAGYLEVWFGFYPGTDITGYKTLLHNLNDSADYCIAGFEVELGTAINEHGEEAETLSPNFEPYCLLRNGEIKWCGKGVSNEMENLIEENLKTAGLIE